MLFYFTERRIFSSAPPTFLFFRHQSETQEKKKKRHFKLEEEIKGGISSTTGILSFLWHTSHSKRDLGCLRIEYKGHSNMEEVLKSVYRTIQYCPHFRLCKDIFPFVPSNFSSFLCFAPQTKERREWGKPGKTPAEICEKAWKEEERE